MSELKMSAFYMKSGINTSFKKERDTKKVAHSLLVLNCFSHTENWRVGGGRLVNKAINMTRIKRQTQTSSETPR